MKLLFDLWATQSAARGADGGGEYSRAVFKALAERADRQQVAAFHFPEHPLDDEVRDLVQDYGVELVPVRDKAELQRVLGSGEYSSFMSGIPYGFHGLDFSGLTVFFAVHGLRPLEQSMPFCGRHYARGPAAKLKWLAKYGLERVRPDWRLAQFQGLASVPCEALHLIVPSWHTRYSLLEKLTLPARCRIHEFYCPEPAACRVRAADSSVLDRLGLEPGHYLFMVSGNRWIKNAWRGLKAVTEVMDKLPDDRWLPVVVTGGVPGGLPRGRRRYVVPAGFLTAEEMAAVYRGARAFFYPTLNEGFGYPPFEAMAQGTPVLCSAISSLTEVVGDAGIYFSPTEMDEIKIRLRLAVEDDDLLAEYRQRGQRRLAEVRQRQETDLAALCDLLLASVTDQ